MIDPSVAGFPKENLKWWAYKKLIYNTVYNLFPKPNSVIASVSVWKVIVKHERTKTTKKGKIDCVGNIDCIASIAVICLCLNIWFVTIYQQYAGIHQMPIVTLIRIIWKAYDRFFYLFSFFLW